MAGTDTIVGQFGLIPEDIYLRKIERSCTFEDPDQTEDYQRNLLKDLRPDVPYFESDLPRRNYQSTQAINLRDGGRREKVNPDLPDGLQLNFDPWVIDTPAGPDFQKHVDQQKSRAKYINFYPDADNSIPESGIHPTHMVKQIKAAQPWVQNRLKIFETSMDNMQHGFMPQIDGCKVEKVKLTTEVPRLNDCSYRTRIGNTSAFSNDTQLGFRTNVDHPFKIARYGMIKAGSPATDFYINREGTHVDHRIPILHEGINISPDLALLMVDLALKKSHAHQIGKDNIIFPGVRESANRTIKITPADMAGIQARQTAQTAALAANVAYEGKIIGKQTLGLIYPTDLSMFGKSIIDPNIIEFIASLMTNRQMRTRETDDLRDKIEKTAKESGVFVMDKTTALRESGPQVYESLVSREAEKSTKKAEESKQIFNYAALAKNIENTPGNTMGLQAMEAYKSLSKERSPDMANTNLTLPHNMTVSTTDGYFAPLAGKTKDRYTGGMGSKYNFANMDKEDQSRIPDRENR